jgi:transketolase
MTRVESFRKTFGEALLDIAQGNRDVVVLDADLMKSTYTYLFASEYPDRFIQVGISEQDLICTAAGLAIAGKLPIASSYAMFIMRAWEQIRNTIARDRLNVKLVGTHAGLSDYLDGASHQCIEDISIMRVIPNMAVTVPADSYSLKTLLEQGINYNGPFYMRIGRDYAPRVYSGDERLEFGKVSVVRDGCDICIASCGIGTYLSMLAVEELKKSGIDVALIDLHTIKPLDKATIIKIAKNTGRFVVVEEHNVIGGLAASLAEILSEYYPCIIKRVGINDVFGRSSRDYISLLEYYGLTTQNIIKSVGEVINEV